MCGEPASAQDRDEVRGKRDFLMMGKPRCGRGHFPDAVSATRPTSGDTATGKEKGLWEPRQGVRRSETAQGRLTTARRSAPARLCAARPHARVRLGQDRLTPSTAKTQKLRSVRLLREKEPTAGWQPVPKVWVKGTCTPT